MTEWCPTAGGKSTDNKLPGYETNMTLRSEEQTGKGPVLQNTDAASPLAPAGRPRRI